MNKVQELNRTPLVVPPQEPTMPFRDHQRRCHQWRRLREQSPEKRMVAVRPVQKGNQSRRVDIRLSLSSHTQSHRWTRSNADLQTRPCQRNASREHLSEEVTVHEPRDGRTRRLKSLATALLFAPEHTLAHPN